MLLVCGYKGNVLAVARHLRWPETKVRAAINYADVFLEEIEEAMSENDAAGSEVLKRMLPRTAEFVSTQLQRSECARKRTRIKSFTRPYCFTGTIMETVSWRPSMVSCRKRPMELHFWGRDNCSVRQPCAS